MERPGLRAGHLVALVGGGIVLLGLWLPWFQVELGAAERARFSQGAGQLGQPFAALADGFFSQLDGMRVTGWQAFGGEDVALAGGATLTILAVLASATPAGAPAGIRVDPSGSARLAQIVGLLLGGLILVRLADGPLPSEFVSLGAGGWVSLSGCVLLLVGGTLVGPEAPVSPVPAFPHVVAAPLVPVLAPAPEPVADWSGRAPAPLTDPARSVAPPPRRPG